MDQYRNNRGDDLALVADQFALTSHRQLGLQGITQDQRFDNT